eukprot:TRINITY_DN54688_c0_g1_i1.p2 TRINITY_DN54688_c0_g1~~TRINITY_DN54688_c0_g1_i1.p2  ORF type:complete len:348 (-),score=43.84 TRINITY_DN54688_c0_g1_i1:81-1124(-)
MVLAPQEVPRVPSASTGALLGQAGRPFIISHDLASKLDWPDEVDVADLFPRCRFARAALWHTLLSPDGVVGQYDRAKWGVDVANGDSLVQQSVSDEKTSEAHHESSKLTHAGEESAPECAASSSSSSAFERSPCHLRWIPLAGQASEALDTCPPPRHVTTMDLPLESALCLWAGTSPCQSAASLIPDLPKPYVYLRGTLPSVLAKECLENSVFQELLASSCFGSKPFSATLYASQRGLQTNLHVDEHSGFLVQVWGTKRVVLFSKSARSLRCDTWGQLDVPVNRRSWFHSGVPDKTGWLECQPFDSLQPFEVELGPGEALFIPRGWFHDVLSRSQQTLGLVLRCHGC